jgi:hypothetical protein
MTVRMSRPYLLSVLAAAVVTALVVGCIRMQPSMRPPLWPPRHRKPLPV